MTRPAPASRFLCLLGLFAGLLATDASADITYNFANTSGSAATVGSVNWSIYGGGSAAIKSASLTGPSGRSSISAANGPDGDAGFLAMENYENSSLIALALVTFATPLELTSVSWKMANTASASGANVRVIVQSGGTWYATSSNFSTTALSDFTNPESESFTFSTLKSNWQKITLTPGVELRKDSAAIGSDLSSNTITGIGFYYAFTANNTVRIDDVTVVGAAIPEPSTYTLMLGFAALGFIGFRRLRIHR